MEIDLEGIKKNGAQYLPIPKSDMVLKVGQAGESVAPPAIEKMSQNMQFI